MKSMRDHNGDIMSSKDYHLKKLGLYQKGNYMQPIVLSNSIEIKKSDYQNVSQSKKKDPVNIDQTKQKIIAGIIAAENEALGT